MYIYFTYLEELSKWHLNIFYVGLIFILIIDPSVVDGEWTQWVSSGSCKTNGKRERTRTCSKPAPLNGGKQCPGLNKDEVSCPGGQKKLVLE